MSDRVSTIGALSRKKLDGIYWRTFVDFVNRNDLKSREQNHGDEKQKLERREGSFEYMELTARDGASLQSSESDSCCSSSENSTSDSSSRDEKSAPMYAVLDMSRKKEIQITDEIAVFDGSPVKRVPGESDKDEEAAVNDKDVNCEEDSFDQLESTSPSMEPAPWKDQSLSIQRWMVPHILHENEDDFVAFPDVVPMPNFEYCHYIPTLEVIMEESEESSDSGGSSLRCRLSKSASYSDDAPVEDCDADTFGWNSANNLTNVCRSQDDLFSISSTCGSSLGSMRRIGTFENLSFDAEDGDEEETDGSSDELDRADDDRDLAHENDKFTNHEPDENHQIDELSTELFPPEENCVPSDDLLQNDNLLQIEQPDTAKFFTVPNATSDVSSEASSFSGGGMASSTEVLPAASTQSLLESELQSSGRGSPIQESAPEQSEGKFSEALSTSLTNLRMDSGIDGVTNELTNDIDPASFQVDLDNYDSVATNEINIPGLPHELYIDEEDIPKIVVMFAQQELAKERRANQAQLKHEDCANEDLVHYRPRSSTYDPEMCIDSAYSSQGVQRRIDQMKSDDTSRLSTLSSSTPELSNMPEDALLYIPVSYASEAAAKRKKKRGSTMSSAEAAHRGRTTPLQTKLLISGTGLGNGFTSLRKRLKSRRSAGNPVRRSQSAKPQLSYSSPDISSPMTKFLNSPRRRSKEKPWQDSPPKVEGRRRGIRYVVSNIFRRLSSKFHRPSSSNGVITDDVMEQKSPAKSNLEVVKEESCTSESISLFSSPRGSVVSPTTMDRCVGPSPRRVSCDLETLDIPENIANFRQRSFSVPARPLSKTPSSNYASTESDVFESVHSSVEENSLDQTIYV